MTEKRKQLIYLATARNYAKQGDKPLYEMCLAKAHACELLSQEQEDKMLWAWRINNESRLDNVVLSFQVIEQADEPRAEGKTV